MSIHIVSEGWGQSFASLCEEDWELPSQIAFLETWLAEHRAELPMGRWIADVGFSVRKGASGGGAAISPEMMRMMADLGMSLYLSEYGGDLDDSEDT